MCAPRKPQVAQLSSTGESCITDYWWHKTSLGYASRRRSKKDGGGLIYAHQSVMTCVLGRKLKKGEEVDHINGDRLDNRRENLRVVTHKKNLENMHTKRPFRGVSWKAKLGKYVAHVTHNYRYIHSGCFSDRHEAMAVSAQKRKDLGFASET